MFTRHEKKYEILSIKVICKEPGRYIAWPTITKAANGDLLVVFSGDRTGHAFPDGKTHLIRSKDNGKTWSEPVTITDTPLDDRDAGIITLNDGTLVVSWFSVFRDPDHPKERHKSEAERESWRPIFEKLTEEEKEKWQGHWIRRSTDNGYTWGEPIRTVASAPHGPVELSDGSLLYLGTGKYNGCVVAEKSYDKGKTWIVESKINQFVDDKSGSLCEPHSVEVDKNHIVAMFRYVREHEYHDENYTNLKVLWQSESSDGGKTWTKPFATDIWGEPPHLIKLKDGRIMVTYGHRKEPYGQRACFSYNGGKTWDYDNEIILSNPGSGDLGYAASLELDDDAILSVYYERDNPEEKTCIKATHWKPLKKK